MERNNSHINSSLVNVEEVKAGIRDKLEKSQEMLSVGEQRELYFQLLVLQSLKDDEQQSKTLPLKIFTLLFFLNWAVLAWRHCSIMR